MYDLYCAIDPDSKGYIVCIDKNRDVKYKTPLLSEEKEKGYVDLCDFQFHFRNICKLARNSFRNVKFFIEEPIIIPAKFFVDKFGKQRATRGQSAVAMRTQLRNYYAIWTMIWYENMPKEEARGQTWQADILRGYKKELDIKDRIMAKAIELFPNENFAGPRGGKLQSKADAFLMAEYILRKDEINDGAMKVQGNLGFEDE